MNVTAENGARDPEGGATVEREAGTFRLRYAVRRWIDAPASMVWSLLTDADAFSSWNSTVDSLEGPIAAGARLAIRVPAAPGRVFRPRVVELDAPRRMVWQDGVYPMFRGTRTFSLREEGSRTEFMMVEVLEGLMLPLARGSLPDFAPIFARYADDLARASVR